MCDQLVPTPPHDTLSRATIEAAGSGAAFLAEGTRDHRDRFVEAALGRLPREEVGQRDVQSPKKREETKKRTGKRRRRSRASRQADLPGERA